jgi:hypothetical protein
MDFYATTAQVIPVLLLALIWESKYLESLKDASRAVRFWTKPRVRIWALFVSAAAVAGQVAALLVLADLTDPGEIPRWVAIVGLASLLGSLLVRLTTDILDATK